MIVIGHLSDIHIDGSERSMQRARRVTRYLAGLPVPVDVVLATGDLADHGAAAEYEGVRDVLDIPVPVLVCPGNHDVREPFRKVLLGEPASDAPINRAHRVAGAFFAMCDSSVPGADDGYLADETLDWLDAELTSAADLPAFVCFHHPPVVLGQPFIDRIRQSGAERLSDVVGWHPNVVALLCGHAHTPAASTFAGRPLLVAPGVASTLMLPFEGDTLLDYDQPTLIAFHILDDDRRLTTHYRVVR